MPFGSVPLTVSYHRTSFVVPGAFQDWHVWTMRTIPRTRAKHLECWDPVAVCPDHAKGQSSRPDGTLRVSFPPQLFRVSRMATFRQHSAKMLLPLLLSRLRQLAATTTAAATYHYHYP